MRKSDAEITNRETVAADEAAAQRGTSQSEAPPAPAVLLGARLRQARIEHHLTQSDVAKNQFSVSYISAVERGQIRPSLGALERLAARLQVPIAELVRPGDAEATSTAARRTPYIPAAVREEVDTLLAEARVRLLQHDADGALRILRGLPSTVLSSREEAMVAWRSAEALRQLKRIEEARASAQRALTLAEHLHDPELRERIRLEWGRTLMLAGNTQAAVEALAACRAALERDGMPDPVFAVQVLLALGEAQQETGDVEAAVATLAEAAELTQEALAPERLGARYWKASVRYRDQGDLQQARVYAERSLTVYEAVANRRVARRVMVGLGRAYAAAGHHEAARTHLEAALRQAESQQNSERVADAQAALAGVYLRLGHTEEAVRAAEQAMDAATSADDALLAAEAQLVLAQALAARGDTTQAQATFEQTIARLQGVAAPAQLGDAYAQYSAFLERRGDDKRAFEVLKQAWMLRERASLER